MRFWRGLLVLMAACGALEPQEIDTDHPIVGGEPWSDASVGIGRFSAAFAGSGRPLFSKTHCTASLIDYPDMPPSLRGRVLVTNAHCVWPIEEFLKPWHSTSPASSAYFFDGTGKRTLSVSAAPIAYPKTYASYLRVIEQITEGGPPWLDLQPEDAFDIALVVVPKVSLKSIQHLAALALPSVLASWAKDYRYDIAGFGQTPSGERAGKLARGLRVTQTQTFRDLVEFHRDDAVKQRWSTSDVAFAALRGGGAACEGDSGGPAMPDVACSAPVLDGLTIGGDSDCSNPSGRTVVIPVFLHVPWIRCVLARYDELNEQVHSLDAYAMCPEFGS